MWRGESIITVLIDRLLEKTGINDTDAHGCTAMHYLIKRMDQIDAIRYLLKLGADVNVMNHKGNMPLHEMMKGTMMSKVDENGVRDPSQSWDSPYSRREELVKILVDEVEEKKIQ
ncbi:ankyrin [Penicillium odoratum]|uniref:ankyrin n=1 Tax=Penicillium odoratum TaxID=1167516 RepID=UPI002547267B|nr:ankyrin [Penicillium odoratum]KAJ5752984.1 ankyrin [Penicillium odoratum]